MGQKKYEPVEKLEEPIWERQPRETDLSWGAFRAYRDKPPHERSLRKLAVELYGVERNSRRWRTKVRSLAHLSRRWRWRERVEAWDAYWDEVDRREREKAIREMNERHIRIARELIQKAAQRLQNLDASSLSPTELRQFFNDGVRLERLALGEPESVTRDEGITQIEVVWGVKRGDDEE